MRRPATLHKLGTAFTRAMLLLALWADALVHACPTFRRCGRTVLRCRGLIALLLLLGVTLGAILLCLLFAGTAWTSFPLVALIAIIQLDILTRLGYAIYYGPVPLDSAVAFPETEHK